jgi:hypothetical protein
MSDERRWTLRGGGQAKWRTTYLEDGPMLDLGESIPVMPVAEHEAALARVERGWDEAREEAATISDALGAMTDERDALRAQVEALTGERAVEAFRYAEAVVRSMARNNTAPDTRRAMLAHADALAAARDAAAANTPEQATEDGDCERDCIDQCQGPCGVGHLVGPPDQPAS